MATKAWDIALDGAHVYWLELDSGSRVRRADKQFENTTTIALSGGLGHRPRSLVVDESGVYWTVYEQQQAVVRWSPCGGAPMALVSGAFRPYLLATDREAIYIEADVGTHGVLLRSLKTGGGVTTLAMGAYGGGLAVDENSIYRTLPAEARGK